MGIPGKFLIGAVVLFSGIHQAAFAQGNKLDDDVLKRIKHATVYLRVKLGNGNDVQGTGWFVEKNLIVTNTHVMGIIGSASRTPQKIEAVIDSGEPNSRTVAGKYVGGDIDFDLALIRVEGEDLPEPLPLGSTASLAETEDVLIFGFPFGKELGKNITVSRSSITSLRRENGLLKEIQVNGGMNPGNSGGPVVNQAGQVVGIAVRVITGTSINFAIPVDKLSQLMNGRVTSFATELAFLDGSQIKFPLRITTYDPLKRLKSVQVEHWIGQVAKNRIRPVPATKPEPAPGDGEIQVVKLPYEGKSPTTIEVPVPPLADENSCYWFRIQYVDGTDTAGWTTAVGNLRPIPVDRRESSIAFQPKVGAAAPMLLTNDSAFKVVVGGKTESQSMHVKVIMNPTFQAPEADGDIHARVRFSSVTLGMKVNDEAVNMKEHWTPVAQAFLKTSADIEYDEDGTIVQSRADVGKADPKLKSHMTAISDHLLQSIEVMTVALSNHAIRPAERVRARRSLLIGLPGFFVPAEADVKYQYLGVRTLKDGTELAVFDVAGTLRPRRGDEGKVAGRISGTVEMLPATGEVFAGKSVITVDLELALATPIRLFGSLISDYHRAPPAPSTTTPAETQSAGDKAKPDAAKPAESAGNTKSE